MKLIHTPAHWLGSIALSVLMAACSTTPSLELKANPASLEEGHNITLSATLNSASPVKQVEFYMVQSAGNMVSKVGEDTSFPYELSFPLLVDQPGEVHFSAKAIGMDGSEMASQTTKVLVGADQQAPSISLAASSTSLNAASTITLIANASDNLGVVRVEFFRGSSKLGQDTTAADGFSLNVALTAEDVGTSNYSAKAYDARGNSSTSGQVSVVLDMDVVPPSISLVSSKASLNQPGFFSLVASASDNVGVAKVEFYNGALKLGEKTSAPFVWQVGYVGNYHATESYSAKAYDAATNSALSNTVDVDVDIDISSPSVSLTSSLTTVTSPGSITLTATASDNRGVVKVEFYDGTTRLGEDTTAVDGFAWTASLASPDNSVHSYTAKAFDAAGNSKVSGAVLVTVQIP